MSVRFAVVVGGDFIPLARFSLESEVIKVIPVVQGPFYSLPGGQSSGGDRYITVIVVANGPRKDDQSVIAGVPIRAMENQEIVAGLRGYPRNKRPGRLPV